MPDATHILIAADAASLIDALPIEPGGVRSTRIHKGPGATIVRLSMDAGTVMKEHIAQAPLLVSVLDGRVALEVGGERIELGAGGLLHIGERVPHAVEALTPSHLVLTLGTRSAATPGADAAG
ncbi:cupin domain-containing protein [Agromyces sp. NPDC049794]|uniref:cupin domain-containing protein n=1 Tax=unclassified Agromyces TaxID=2639701 RepID=UPI0033C24B5D